MRCGIIGSSVSFLALLYAAGAFAQAPAPNTHAPDVQQAPAAASSVGIAAAAPAAAAANPQQAPAAANPAGAPPAAAPEHAGAPAASGPEFVAVTVNPKVVNPDTPINTDEFKEQPVDTTAAAATAPDATQPESLFGFLATAPRSSALLGDMWGLRPLLARGGMTLTIQEVSEVLGNVSGGQRQGFEYEGLTTATLQMDTSRAFGWDGGLFNVSAEQVHGRNLSADNLLNLQTASGIEADRSTRLWELWYQQKFLDGLFDVKIGQQSLDQEFMVSQNALAFVNTMFGWPMVPSADLPGGGPAYPLSALGLRLRVHPTGPFTFLAGVFNGSPSPDKYGDPQKNDPSGTSFPLNGGVLAIAEVQYAYPSNGTTTGADGGTQMPLTYKLGIWYDSESFDDQRYDDMGLSLANPASDGTPASHRGNYSVYAVADQMIWQSAEDTGHNLNIFLRPMIAPQQDRNPISFSLNAGLTLHEPFEGRTTDTFGLGIGFARVSNSVSGLDQDTAFYNPGIYSPVQHDETFIEATYQYQVMPWWQIQPDIQYVFNPGGGIANPNNPTQKVKNEAVLGVRTNILF